MYPIDILTPVLLIIVVIELWMIASKLDALAKILTAGQSKS
jgi:hypothetical protein